MGTKSNSDRKNCFGNRFADLPSQLSMNYVGKEYSILPFWKEEQTAATIRRSKSFNSINEQMPIPKSLRYAHD